MRIGILTNPVSESVDCQVGPDQYILQTNKNFIEQNGKAVAVPIRFDLINEPALLRQTLDSVDGVFFPGGWLSTRKLADMPPVTQTFVKTATEILKYAMATNLPLIGICQGFTLLCQIIVQEFEQQVTDKSETQTDYHAKHRDDILAQIIMSREQRATIWKTDYSKIKFFN
jgi:gamma-glutamyl-gamma-aminobutyrate hydrolase PuuD